MERTTVYRAMRWLVTIAAIYLTSLRTGFLGSGGRLSRRALIRLAGMMAAGLATGTWRNLGSAGAAPSESALQASCLLAPEQTEGPYYIPREKLRSNITEGRPGTPLQLHLTVVDAASCKPIKGAAVDIWHCDALGVYSGFVSASTGGAPGGGGPTDKQTFMRGIQLTNAKGVAQFQTVYPGWYRGRTVHVHVKVHIAGANGHVVHTGQLYFSDSLTARVYQSAPYKARAASRDTFNNTDGIYQNGGRQSTLTVKRSGRGYLGSITLGVRRS